MSRIVDITDKLNFEEKPSIKIKGTVIAVNNDAPSMLKASAIMEGGNISSAQIAQLSDLLFEESEQEKLNSLNLSIEDYVKTIMQTALVAANRFDTEVPEGEEQTPATT